MATKRKTARGAGRLRKALRQMGMDDDMLALCAELISNVGFLEDALWNARIDLMGAPIVVDYDNGGGQSGMRKHPGLEAYSRLYQQYLQGIRTLIEKLPGARAADLVDSSAAATMAALRRAEKERQHG